MAKGSGRHLPPALLCLFPSLVRFGGLPCDTSVPLCFTVLFVYLLVVSLSVDGQLPGASAELQQNDHAMRAR